MMQTERIVKLLLIALAVTPLTAAQAATVEVRHVADQSTIEVRIDGTLFTAYQYSAGFEDKPVFYPLLSAQGTMLNRGYPIRQDVADEDRDHPHHQSLFLGYGNVNGIDFWSNAGNPHIVHRAILGISSGETGMLDVMLDWNSPEGETVVQERKEVQFGTGDAGARWIDFRVTLTALDRPVVFADTKEGMFALRVATALQEKGGNGRYINASGWETSPKIWGTRSPWVALRGNVDGEDVTIAIFDHPSTDGYPSYWHARDYGLFAVNPFGRKDFVSGAEPLNRSLAPGKSVHFRYRLAVYPAQVDKEQLDRDYLSYIQ